MDADPEVGAAPKRSVELQEEAYTVACTHGASSLPDDFSDGDPEAPHTMEAKGGTGPRVRAGNLVRVGLLGWLIAIAIAPYAFHSHAMNDSTVAAVSVLGCFAAHDAFVAPPAQWSAASRAIIMSLTPRLASLHVAIASFIIHRIGNVRNGPNTPDTNDALETLRVLLVYAFLLGTFANSLAAG